MSISTLTPRNPRSRRALGDAYLKFQLTQDAASVIPMHQVQEVLALPSHRLTPMPNMPACVLGLMNRRSQVVWVVNLAGMFGIPNMDISRREHDVMIVRAGAIALGLSVQQINGTCWITPEGIQPTPEQIAPSLQPYLRGCVVQDQEIALVLDAEAIIHSAELHNQCDF